MDIVKEIGEAATLEQLAEECAELSKAALKMARVLRKNNPTPVTSEEARANLCEEAGDVCNCIELLKDANILSINRAEMESKIQRWKNRIKTHKGE